MKILVLSWRDPKHPLAGGAEQIMHEHAKGWIKAGHKITLFSSRFKGSKKEEIIDGIQVIRKGFQYLGVQIEGLFFYLKNKHNFDFVIDQFHGLPFFTPLYVRKPKIAIVQETARKVWFLNPLPKPLNWIIGVIGYLGEPLIFHFYKNTNFMTGSTSAKNDISRFGIDKKNITVVPHGILIKKFKTLPKKENLFTIAYLGILSKDKGVEDALKCFYILDKKGKFNFWVIGKPETKQYAKKINYLTKKLGMDKKIKFWGFVSQNLKFKLLAKAHLLVNPSTREGWGLVNIEANTYRVPIVSYKAAGLVDSVKNNVSGVFCKENTPEELAKNISKLLLDQKKYIKLSKDAIIWSKKFNWDKSIDLSLKLIRRLSRYT